LSPDIFPQYRKYSNNKSFFRLTGPGSFEELNIMGKYFHQFRIEATRLPERNLLADLLAGEGDIIVISEAEYLEVLDTCQKSRELLPSP
jgi:hypothetical protein